MFLVILYAILFSSMHLLEKLFEELIQCNATVYLSPGYGIGKGTAHTRI